MPYSAYRTPKKKVRILPLSKQTLQSPILCIDLKKNRIRIHRCTLQMIGNPEYIQLLINPEEKKIAVKRSTRNDRPSYRMHINSPECCELYSTYFMEKLMSVGTHLETNQSYRLYGKISAKDGIAFFSLNESIPIEEN